MPRGTGKKSATLEIPTIEVAAIELEAAVVAETVLTEAVTLELAEASAIEISAIVEVPTERFNMGEFAVLPHAERQYVSVYFGIREMYGQAVKLRDKDIDWQAFNAKFEECFGKVEEKIHSIEKLQKFAWDYFHKTIEEVVEYNRKSLARRREKGEVEIPKPKAVEISMDDIPY